MFNYKSERTEADRHHFQEPVVRNHHSEMRKFPRVRLRESDNVMQGVTTMMQSGNSGGGA